MSNTSVSSNHREKNIEENVYPKRLNDEGDYKIRNNEELEDFYGKVNIVGTLKSMGLR